MRLTSMESRIFFAKFNTQKFLPSHPSRMGTCGDLEAVRRPFYQPRRWFFAFKPFYRCMGRWESSLSRKSMYYSLIWLVQSMLQLVAVDFPPPNWSHRQRLWPRADTFQESLGSIAYLHILGRWKLLGGVGIGSISQVLGWDTQSTFWWRSVLEDAGWDLEALRWPIYRPLFLFCSFKTFYRCVRLIQSSLLRNR